MRLDEHDPTRPDPLDDFDRRALTFLDRTKDVFVAGRGPAVIVMSEMPGIYPLVARFARRVRDAGFTVWMPHLFGEPGRPLSTGYMVGSIIRACIGREFRAFSANESSPVTDWLRALAAHAHPACAGRAGAGEGADGTRGPHRPGLPLRRGRVLPRPALRRLRGGARRPLRGARAAGLGG